VRRWEHLRVRRGRVGVDRICGGLRCRRWRDIWSGRWSRRRCWRGF